MLLPEGAEAEAEAQAETETNLDEDDKPENKATGEEALFWALLCRLRSMVKSRSFPLFSSCICLCWGTGWDNRSKGLGSFATIVNTLEWPVKA